MKNATAQAKKFAALLQQLRKQVELPPSPATGPTTPIDPVTQVVMAFLQWNSTRKAAESAYARLMEALVDTNDLRVSHPDELLVILGERYPQVHERTHRLHDVLQEIYVRAHGMSLENLRAMGKKEVRQYLESLPGITQSVAASVALLCFDCHAIPVDDTLARLLAEHGAAEEGASVEHIASFLEHHVKAGEAVETYLLLQNWADTTAGKSAPKPAKAAAGKPSSAKPAHKPAKAARGK